MDLAMLSPTLLHQDNHLLSILNYNAVCSKLHTHTYPHIMTHAQNVL